MSTTEHARLIRPFLNWFLLRRSRARARRRPFPAAIGRQLRRRVKVALEFLTWTDEQGITLAGLSQDDIDRWLGEGQTQRRYQVSYFLGWTADRSLRRRLTIPRIPHQEPEDVLGDDQRWELLQPCLTDDALPIPVCAAGSLVLLFGLHLQRIRHLTADQVTEVDGRAYLTAGHHPVLLPPRLGALIRDLASQSPPRLMISSGPSASRWLFPGHVPGQPVHLLSLTTQLNRHGISARPARNGALIALATDLPAAILADFLGLHVNTAVRWVSYARSDWTGYLAARDLAPESASTKEPDGQHATAR